MKALPISVDHDRLAAICRRWKIRELALFGSVLGDRFGPGSDVDVLVAFETSARWTLFDLTDLQADLEELFKRPVDVVSRRGLEASRNTLRRRAILSEAEVLYAA